MVVDPRVVDICVVLKAENTKRGEARAKGEVYGVALLLGDVFQRFSTVV